VLGHHLHRVLWGRRYSAIPGLHGRPKARLLRVLGSGNLDLRQYDVGHLALPGGSGLQLDANLQNR